LTLSLLLWPLVDVIIMVLCPICKTNMPDTHLRYHLMKCDLISKTGDRLVDMIITYVRSNGDYDKDGADLSKVLPMLQASGWTADQLMEVLEALEEDQIIRSRRVGLREHHFKFNYKLK
jgi:hypothetical protein